MAKKRIGATREGTEGIGDRLVRLRKARGITQVELAQMLQTTQSLVSKYERGDYLLHGELIVKLARILRVSTDELLGAERGKAKPLPVIKDRRIARRIEKLEQLPRRDREAVLRTLDAFLSRVEPTERRAG